MFWFNIWLERAFYILVGFNTLDVLVQFLKQINHFKIQLTFQYIRCFGSIKRSKHILRVETSFNTLDVLVQYKWKDQSGQIKEFQYIRCFGSIY